MWTYILGHVTQCNVSILLLTACTVADERVDAECTTARTYCARLYAVTTARTDGTLDKSRLKTLPYYELLYAPDTIARNFTK